MSQAKELTQLLEGLQDNLPKLLDAIIATTDGLAVAHLSNRVGDSIDIHSVAAMAAAALGLGKRLTSGLYAGGLKEAQVTGEHGQVLIYAIGEKAALALVVESSANVGMVNFVARRILPKLSQLM
ncbi:MAG: roadblock/LC7 domain-containing protein [Deinococcales bacterium]